MKGVIVQIKNKHAAVLSEDGIVKKIKNDNYEIGQTVTMQRKAATFTKKTAMAFAAAAAVIVLTAIGFASYYIPAGYVSIDVNPSVESSVNIYDRVIGVKGVNDDGTLLLDDLDLKNIKIEIAIERTVIKLIEKGYITNDENGGIVISVLKGNEDSSGRLAKKLKEKAEGNVKDSGKTAEVEGIAVGKKRVEKAKELGVTPGKLNLVEKLKDSSSNPDEVVIEEWLDKPVKEIMKQIKENRKSSQNGKDKDKDGEKGGGKGKSKGSEEDNDNSEENKDDTTTGETDCNQGDTSSCPTDNGENNTSSYASDSGQNDTSSCTSGGDQSCQSGQEKTDSGTSSAEQNGNIKKEKA